jgi:hypothetical protein
MFQSEKDLRKAVPKKTSNHSKSAVKTDKLSVSVSSTSQTVQNSCEFNSSAVDTPDVINIVEVAQRERLLRQQQRDQTKVALRLQCWWRGRHTSRLWKRNLVTSVEKRITDVENLSKLMLTTQKITFLPPLDVSINLLKEITFLLTQKIPKFLDSLLVRYLRSVFLPLLQSSVEFQKSFFSLFNFSNSIALKVFNVFVSRLLTELSVSGSYTMDSFKVIVLSLRTLFLPSSSTSSTSSTSSSSPPPSCSMKEEEQIIKAKQFLFSKVILEGDNNSNISHSSVSVAISAPSLFYQKFRVIFLNHPIFRRILRITSVEEMKEVYLSMINANNPGEVFLSIKNQLIPINSDLSFFFDSLFTFVIDIALEGESIGGSSCCSSSSSNRGVGTSVLLDLLIEKILSIPFLTFLVSHRRLLKKLLPSTLEITSSFSSSLKQQQQPQQKEGLLMTMIVKLLKKRSSSSSSSASSFTVSFSSSTLATSLPSLLEEYMTCYDKDLPDFIRGYFILGNLLSFIPLAFSLPSPSSSSSSSSTDSFSSPFILPFLSLADLLLTKYPIPGILQGNAGINWKRSSKNNSSHLTAIGIPYFLTFQFLQLYDSSFLKILFSSLFPLSSSFSSSVGGASLSLNWSLFQCQADNIEIERSLLNSSFSLIQHQFEEQKAAKNLWFQPSKWASKLGLSNWNVSSSSSSSSSSSTFAVLPRASPAANRVPAAASAVASSSSSSSSGWFGSLLGFGGKSGSTVANSESQIDPLDASSQHPLLSSTYSAPSAPPSANIPAAVIPAVVSFPTEISHLEVTLPKTEFTSVVNYLLFLILHGSMSRMDSLPWKSISFLTFSLPSLPFLWFYLEENFIKGNSSRNNIMKCIDSFDVDKHFFALNEKVSLRNEELLSQPFNCIFLFCGILKIYLIALDDLELYEQQVEPITFYCFLCFLGVSLLSLLLSPFSFLLSPSSFLLTPFSLLLTPFSFLLSLFPAVFLDCFDCRFAFRNLYHFIK